MSFFFVLGEDTSWTVHTAHTKTRDYRTERCSCVCVMGAANLHLDSVDPPLRMIVYALIAVHVGALVSNACPVVARALWLIGLLRCAPAGILVLRTPSKGSREDKLMSIV